MFFLYIYFSTAYPMNRHAFGFSLQRCSQPFLLPEYHGLNQKRSAIFRALRNTSLHSVFFRPLSPALCLIIFFCVNFFYHHLTLLCIMLASETKKSTMREDMSQVFSPTSLISSCSASVTPCIQRDCTIPMFLD